MKKGISLAVLSLSIIIIIILVTCVSITGVNLKESSYKIKVASELAYLQEIIDNYYLEHNLYPVSSSVVLNIQNVSSNSLFQFNDENIVGNKITLYEIDYSKLNKVDLTYGKKNEGDILDLYAVSKGTGKVYYLKGFKTKKITYYTLTDELMNNIKYKRSIQNSVNGGIIFDLSNEKFTNKNIETVVKIPNCLNYKDIVVTVKKNNQIIKTIPLTQKVGNYDIYKVNEIAGNYTVEVLYNVDSKQNIKKYDVMNFDSEAPKFSYTVSDLKNTEENIDKKYIKINVEDDISGIKLAKYEIENINNLKAKEYFINNGNNIVSDVIVVDSSRKYITIYYEDNAGNYTTKLITL